MPALLLCKGWPFRFPEDVASSSPRIMTCCGPPGVFLLGLPGAFLPGIFGRPFPLSAATLEPSAVSSGCLMRCCALPAANSSEPVLAGDFHFRPETKV